MVWSNMMDFVDVLFCGDLSPDDEARQFFRPFWPDAELDRSSPLDSTMIDEDESNDRNGKAWTQ